jgi:hypothetical protein
MGCSSGRYGGIIAESRRRADQVKRAARSGAIGRAVETGTQMPQMATSCIARVLVIASALWAPTARADLPALDRPHRVPQPAASLAVFPAGFFTAAAADAAAEGSDTEGAGSPTLEADDEAQEPSLDFDLLGEAEPPAEPADAGALRLRRKMLIVHQGVGVGLLGLQLATTAVGQLNYSDRFAGGPDTARYKLSHKVLAYTTLGTFAANGAIALLAPSAKTPRKLDRVMVHRIAMFTAAGGMVAQAILGISTRERAGRLDQERLATVHLVVGYSTLAAVLTGVGALVL